MTMVPRRRRAGLTQRRMAELELQAEEQSIIRIRDDELRSLFAALRESEATVEHLRGKLLIITQALSADQLRLALARLLDEGL
jgi:hypothetical protein